MENINLLMDWRLIMLFGVSVLISLLGCTTIATRIAAVKTKKVAMAFAVYNIFFLITRFANLFYLPYLGIYVDKAEQTQNFAPLEFQIRFIIYGSAIGALIGWLLLPTFVEIYHRAIEAMDRHKSMIRVMIKFIVSPRHWIKLVHCIKKPSFMGASLFKTDGAPAGFLVFNIFATAIWTVGALCALYASALHPEFKRTAVLLSGLVNSAAAIMFSMIVDPKASLITDEIVKGKTDEKQIYAVSLHLLLGNVVGSFLGQLFFMPGVMAIDSTAVALGNNEIAGNFIVLAIFNAIVMLKSSTTYASRISAVLTKSVATAIAIYNFFFLLTRISQQIFAPFIGTMVDASVRTGDTSNLIMSFRWLIWGSCAGAVLGLLFMPTFVEIYNKAIKGMGICGSLEKLVFKTLVTPSIWLKAVGCLRLPSLFGIKKADFNSLPKNFLVANIVVISFHTIGVMAAAYASASYPDARGVTLLSSVINGGATILLSLLVEPSIALITDDAVDGKRPVSNVCAMSIFLAGGTIFGTLLSQVIFVPAAEFIKWCSGLLTMVL